MSHPSLIRQAVCYVHVTSVTHTAGVHYTCHTRQSHDRWCVKYMSYPSLTRQAVRHIYVTPVTHMAGGALHMCHIRHLHGRWCVMYMSHPSLKRQAVCYVHVTSVAHTAGVHYTCHTCQSHGRRCVTYMSHPSLKRQAVNYVHVTSVTHTAGVRYTYVIPVTHTAGSVLHICHTRHSHGRRCVTHMSHPSQYFDESLRLLVSVLTLCKYFVTYMSLTRQVVRYTHVTPVTHTTGGKLRICHTRHTALMKACACWFLSRPSVIVSLRICHTCHSHGGWCVTYISHPSLTLMKACACRSLLCRSASIWGECTTAAVTVPAAIALGGEKSRAPVRNSKLTFQFQSP
jgi:hypothetical protein